MVRNFTEEEVDPQALEHNRNEEFNLPLFRKLGELGLLGITVPEEYGGSGMDAVAACVAHEELSAADPAFCLSYLEHSMLFVNNLARNGTHEQKARPAHTNQSIGHHGVLAEKQHGWPIVA